MIAGTLMNLGLLIERGISKLPKATEMFQSSSTFLV